MPRRWLLKSEPEVYSIDDLARDKKTLWEGVRNYQARNFLRDDMKPGDLAFFYHSGSDPSGITGIVSISKVGIPDPTQFNKKSEYFDPKATKENPRWFSPEIKIEKKLARVVALEELRKIRGLENMLLLKRGTRLSVQPVSEKEWEKILEHHSN